MSSLFKKILASFVLAGISTVPLGAELKYTMTIEAHKIAASSDAMPNPMFGLIGGLIVEQHRSRWRPADDGDGWRAWHARGVRQRCAVHARGGRVARPS